MNDRTKGLAIAILGIICVSPDAVLVQYLSTHGSSPWTIIFWKLLVSIPFSLSYTIYEAGGVKKFLCDVSINKRFYFAVVPAQSMIDIGYTLSFVYTSAAIALLLINLNPLWAAIIGKLVLKDELPIRTYVALVLALCCMLIIFIPEMMLEGELHDDTTQEDTTTTSTSLRGNMISIFTGLMFAIYLCIVRKAGQYDVSLVGGTPLGASLSTMIALIVVRAQVHPDLFWDDEIWKFWLAVIGQGAGIGIVFVAMAIAPRYITAPEIGLCILLEAVLGPLLVFFAYKEVPSIYTLIGGSLLLVVLAAHESGPLFEKSREVYRTMSKRFSSTVHEGIDQSHDVSKEEFVGGTELTAKKDSFELNE
eukprot:scaffold7825_cov67-Cyclotella_meneghiniana.AAC.3